MYVLQSICMQSIEVNIIIITTTTTLPMCKNLDKKKDEGGGAMGKPGDWVEHLHQGGIIRQYCVAITMIIMTCNIRHAIKKFATPTRPDILFDSKPRTSYSIRIREDTNSIAKRTWIITMATR